MQMCEFNVAIRQDAAEEKTKGGLILTADSVEKKKHSAVRGTIVALSPMAFNRDIWPDNMERPEVGARVVFAQHSGTFLQHEGEELRIVKDKDIVAVLGNE
jgi:chaperonin GroES